MTSLAMLCLLGPRSLQHMQPHHVPLSLEIWHGRGILLCCTIAWNLVGSACPACHQHGSLSAERLRHPASTSRLQESIQLLEQPLVVHASAVSVPHPEKVRDGTTKAVNKRHHGFAGEDAYFSTSGP